MYFKLHFGTADVSRMRASKKPKTAKFEETGLGAEFCVFKSNALGLKFNFYERYVGMPTRDLVMVFQSRKTGGK